MYDSLIEIIKVNASNMPEDYIISSDTKLIEDLKYDSVDLMQLIIDMEEEFGIDFMNCDILTEKINTPQSLMELILSVKEKDYVRCEDS